MQIIVCLKLAFCNISAYIIYKLKYIHAVFILYVVCDLLFCLECNIGMYLTLCY